MPKFPAVKFKQLALESKKQFATLWHFTIFHSYNHSLNIIETFAASLEYSLIGEETQNET